MRILVPTGTEGPIASPLLLHKCTVKSIFTQDVVQGYCIYLIHYLCMQVEAIEVALSKGKILLFRI